VLLPEPASPQESVYRTAAAEFELSLIDVAEGVPYTSALGRRVELLLGLEGEAALVAENRTLSLAKGRSAFVPAALPGYRIEGRGRVCRAGVPR
jgi:mannose-6-phosphate isomerase class I